MTDTTDFFNLNTAGGQRDLIPANTICTLQLTIKPGGAGDDGWLKLAGDGKSEGLDCEFTVVDGEFAKYKLWQLFTLRGTTPGHAEAGEISRNTFRAMLESARGIKPNDTSEAAQAARKLSGWQELNQLRFVAQIGVRPPRGDFSAKNTIAKVITPERQAWKQPEQITAKPANSETPAKSTTPPGNAIARPQWGGGA